MGKKTEEKTYEERLASLKVGCIILGVLQAFSVASALNSFSKGAGNLGSLIISIILLAMLYFIYKYTAERNPLGPTLEKIYSVLLIIDGILACLSIIGIPLGVIFIVAGIFIYKESDYFKDQIENGGATTTVTSEVSEEELNNVVEDAKAEYSDDENNNQ